MHPRAVTGCGHRQTAAVAISQSQGMKVCPARMNIATTPGHSILQLVFPMPKAPCSLARNCLALQVATFMPHTL